MAEIDFETTNSSAQSGDTSGGSGHFGYFQFDEGRTERLGWLEKCMNDLYQSGRRYDHSQWSNAVKFCLTEDDLRDTHVVAAVLSILTPMSGLGRQVWDVFEKELFGHLGEGSEWTWLKTQFMKMRKEDSSFLKTQGIVQPVQSNVTVGQVDPKTGKINREDPVVPYDKIVIVSLVIMVAFKIVSRMITYYWLANK